MRPFMYPKNSDSRRLSGIAPQFTVTKAALLRGLSRWIRRATSSFPVPEGPVIRTEDGCCATFPATSNARIMAGERAMMSPYFLSARTSALSRPTSGLEPGLHFGLAYPEKDFIGREGLGQVVGRPSVHRVDRQVQASVGGHHQNGRLPAAFPVGVEEFQPTHPGHTDIAENHLGMLSLGDGQPFLPVGGGKHLVTAVTEDQ